MLRCSFGWASNFWGSAIRSIRRSLGRREARLNSIPQLAQNSLAEYIASLSASEQKEALSALTESECEAAKYDWRGFWARPNQLPPAGDWSYWFIQAGRGFGKTRVAAETVRMWAEANPRSRIAIVGPTAHDARKVMVEGESGILTISPPWFRPRFNPSLRELVWPNGTIGSLYTADEPERLRGPQHHFASCDEIASWRFSEAWDNLLFGLRLGDNPRVVVTSTPKPTKLIRDLVADPLTHVTRGSSYDNRANLAPAFFNAIIKRYEGQRLGRQELLGELLEDLPGALWTRAMIDQTRVSTTPLDPRTRAQQPFVRVVVAVDPAVTSSEGANETGIIVAGLHPSGHCYVLSDKSMRATPAEWALEVLRLLVIYKADRIVAEVNNGGDLVESNLRGVVAAHHGMQVGQMLPYRAVRAKRGKYVRAEPVAALYQQGLVHHVGCFAGLEDQMCGYVPDTDMESPDRMDALVWALYDLVVQPAEERVQIAYQGHHQISPY